MKRLGRLFFDILGAAGAIVAIAFGIVAVTGQIPNWTDLKNDNAIITAGWQARDILRETHPEAFWMGVVAIALGAIALICAIISIIMVFRAKSHIKLTVFTWVAMWIGAGIASYALYKYLNIDTADVIKAAVAKH